MEYCKSAVTIILLLLNGYVSAATVTVYGNDVSFTYDDSTLFGAGTVVGNSLFFQPTGFSVQSRNGEGVVITSKSLNIKVNATTPGFAISSLGMEEQGDYIQNVNGKNASVSASGQLGVVSLNKNCGTFGFPCNDSNIFNVDVFADTGGKTKSWSGGTSVNLSDTDGWDSDTDLAISFQNNLTATSYQTGELAQVQKKFGAIGLVINPVPVPAAAWLFASGLLGLLFASRRKSA